MRSKVKKASFWAMIQKNSLESKTDTREHQALALCSAKDVPVILKSAGQTTMEQHQAPAVALHSPGLPGSLGMNIRVRCTYRMLFRTDEVHLLTPDGNSLSSPLLMGC